MSKGFQGPVVHNTGIPEPAWEWNATQLAQHMAPQASVQPVHSTQSSWAHPRLHCRLGFPRAKWSASLLWQQLGCRKRNDNVWKHYFHAPPGCWKSYPGSSLLFILCSLMLLPLLPQSPAPWHISCCKTEPPAETCDKPQRGSNPVVNRGRQKRHWTGTNL